MATSLCLQRRSHLTLWLKEADFRNHTKNLPRKQVAAKSDSSILLSSARSAPESHFPDLSLHVRSSRARRGDAVGFAHGHRGPGPAPDLLGLLQQPPRPDPLVAGPQGAQRVRSHHGRGTVWKTDEQKRLDPVSNRPLVAWLKLVCRKQITEAGFCCVCQNTENSQTQNFALQSMFPV